MKFISRNTAATPRQDELYKAETTWFHVFKAMIDNGDIARIGSYAVTVYLVIKSFTNFYTYPNIKFVAINENILYKRPVKNMGGL